MSKLVKEMYDKVETAVIQNIRTRAAEFKGDNALERLGITDSQLHNLRMRWKSDNAYNRILNTLKVQADFKITDDQLEMFNAQGFPTGCMIETRKQQLDNIGTVILEVEICDGWYTALTFKLAIPKWRTERAAIYLQESVPTDIVTRFTEEAIKYIKETWYDSIEEMYRSRYDIWTSLLNILKAEDFADEQSENKTVPYRTIQPFQDHAVSTFVSYDKESRLLDTRTVLWVKADGDEIKEFNAKVKSEISDYEPGLVTESGREPGPLEPAYQKIYVQILVDCSKDEVQLGESVHIKGVEENSAFETKANIPVSLQYSVLTKVMQDGARDFKLFG